MLISPVCILSSLQSKAIRMGSVPETTTFSSHPVCNNFSRKSFIIHGLFRSKSIFIVLSYVFLIASFNCFICMF